MKQVAKLMQRVAAAILTLYCLFLFHGAVHHLWQHECAVDHCTLMVAVASCATMELPQACVLLAGFTWELSIPLSYSLVHSGEWSVSIPRAPPLSLLSDPRHIIAA